LHEHVEKELELLGKGKSSSLDNLDPSKLPPEIFKRTVRKIETSSDSNKRSSKASSFMLSSQTTYLDSNHKVVSRPKGKKTMKKKSKSLRQLTLLKKKSEL
jgi:hypothetical protein